MTTRTPDPRAAGISTNDYCKLLPRRRYSHEAHGMILHLPSSGLVVVPFAQHRHGWEVVVLEGAKNYPRGGHNLVVGDNEIETAIELTVGEPAETVFVNNREEADALPDGDFILTRTHAGLRKGTGPDGEVLWTRWLKDPLSTADLPEEDFPAAVRPGTGG